MKMFLTILLVANLLLQTPMANEEPTPNEGGEQKDENEQGEEKDTVITKSDIVPCESMSTHLKEVQYTIVDCHNEHRRNVKPNATNMLKMRWSEDLRESAQKWADTCNLNHSEPKDRSKNGLAYGENILMSSVCIPWHLTILQWIFEGINLIYNVGPKNNSVVGHYTQAVTDSTYEVGCGMSQCHKDGNFTAFLVCQYDPAGNQPTSLYKPYDEGPWCGACPNDCDESGKLCTNFCPYRNKAGNCEQIKQMNLCEHFEDECGAMCICKNKII
ncbi:cysteine-rich secretory protein 2-like [Pyxicephalus adspersus]|uniref:cysteine-rich secretory protein 2-like n=1 Tax=Pyxicephalus adspersus TaxID=30357 RepID=UPI003B59C419